MTPGDAATASNSSSTRRAGQLKCVGAIRKAGFLSVKKWILKRRQSVELARKQGWRRYWVCLRGTALLFHSVIESEPHDDNDDAVFRAHANETVDLNDWIEANLSQNQSAQQQQQLMFDGDECAPSGCRIEREPRHLIIVEGAIAQPIPEHPKREHVFCLSTSFGDAYLFQATCQSEADNWIGAVHNACAASIARDLTRDETVRTFESKIRQLELEADKKLFLRQRLESRLTSMSSMRLGGGSRAAAENTTDAHSDKKATLRSLLARLQQQLVALDTYIEQVHCEAYQLRCYLASCCFVGGDTARCGGMRCELPHPRTLLSHVSRRTKVLLTKLGVFTVSSFHAHVHARQGSADSILQRIHEAAASGAPTTPTTMTSCATSSSQMRLRSQSAGETLAANQLAHSRQLALETDTEQLIELSHVKSVRVRVSLALIADLYGADLSAAQPTSRANLDELIRHAAETSDDRYALQRDGQSHVVFELRMQASSNAANIIAYVLRIVVPHVAEFEFLKYYLRLMRNAQFNHDDDEHAQQQQQEELVAKRKDTLADWSDFDHLELERKLVFRVQLLRARRDEQPQTPPFGLGVGAQLFVGRSDSLLNVFATYVEWGSVADRAGVRDDDELLVLNGVPVLDLDLMFVESLIHDETDALTLIVRSSRSSCPKGAYAIVQTASPTSGDDADNDAQDDEPRQASSKEAASQNAPQQQLFPHVPKQQQQPHKHTQAQNPMTFDSQLISDAYVSSLVCPPPPTQRLVRACDDIAATARDSDNRKRMTVSVTVHSLALTGEHTRADMSSEVDDEDVAQHQQPPAPVAQQVSEHSVDANAAQKLRKTLGELLETEYAYIKHLETINEHYMTPLAGADYLHIEDLARLSALLQNLLEFQRAMFVRLVHNVAKSCQMDAGAESAADESDLLDEIVHYVNDLDDYERFSAVLHALACTFSSEAEKFKMYAAYCAAYSKLQKFLHPSSQACTPTSASSHNAFEAHISLDTFACTASNTGSLASRGLNVAAELRRPLGSFANHISALASNHHADRAAPSELQQKQGNQLHQLAEFLTNLDSSSSSLSLTLPRSSISESQHASMQQDKTSDGNCAKASKKSQQNHTNVYQRGVPQQNLESYLIKPVQRIVKYPMLLSSIEASARECLHAPAQHAILKELQTAVKRMSAITTYINDTQRIGDEFGLLLEQIERQYHQIQLMQVADCRPQTAYSPLSHQPHVSLSIEHLLHFGPVGWENIGEFAAQTGGKCQKKRNKLHQLAQTLFVFNSCVVMVCRDDTTQGGLKKSSSASNAAAAGRNSPDLCGLLRYVTLIPVSEVQVRSTSTSSVSGLHDATLSGAPEMSAATSDRYEWELFRCSSVSSNSGLLTSKSTNRRRQSDGKVYLLSCRTNEERSIFLRRIRQIIRDSVRSMQLPVARSPSTKSLTPKKNSSSATASTTTTNSNSSCSQSTSLSPVCKDKGQLANNDCSTHIPLKHGAAKLTVGQLNDGQFKSGIKVNN